MTTIQDTNRPVRAAVRSRQVCDHCGGRFGMVTHRWWGSKFCKRRCKDAYLREIMLDRDTVHRLCGLQGVVSSLHSSSASARSKNVSGIVRPMAFAVLRLTASSNFVGCSMGKSFGCRPCNILCTNFALCRKMAGPSAPYDIRPPASTKPRVVEAVGKRCSSARSAICLVDKLP
jgi:hypothetical protein